MSEEKNLTTVSVNETTATKAETGSSPGTATGTTGTTGTTTQEPQTEPEKKRKSIVRFEQRLHEIRAAID